MSWIGIRVTMVAIAATTPPTLAPVTSSFLLNIFWISLSKIIVTQSQNC